MVTTTSLKEFKKTLADKQTSLKSLLTKGDANEPMTDDDTKDADDLESQIASLKARIARISAALADEADNASEPDDASDDEELSAKSYKPSGVLIKMARDPSEPKGTRFARYVIGAGVGSKMGKSVGVNYVKDKLGDDEVAKALNTTTQTTGGALIPQDFRAEIIDLLYAQEVVRKSGAPVWPMPMGNMTVPKVDGGATAYWQAELDDMTVSQEAFTDVQLTAKKLTALVPVTNDMIRRSPIAVEGIVRRDMLRQLALAEDLAFLAGTGANKDPVGMLNIPGTTQVAGGAATLAGANGTLRAMELGLMAQNVDLAHAQWFWSPYVQQFLASLTDSTGRYFFAEELSRVT